MGNWERLTVVIEPGDRNVNQVAGDLRASLASLDCPGLVHPERAVTVENGRVHWDSGKRYHSVVGLLPDEHGEFDVPCEWLVAVGRYERVTDGGAELYTWVGDGLALVDATGTGDYSRGAASLRYLEWAWGVRTDFEPFARALESWSPAGSAVDTHSSVTNTKPPIARFASRVTEGTVETRDAAWTRLEAAPAGTLRAAVDDLGAQIDSTSGSDQLDALEQLYAAVTSSAVPTEVTPRPVLELLDTRGRAGMLSAAIVRELSEAPSHGRTLSDSPPAVRRQDARYLGLCGVSEYAREPVFDAIINDDTHVRCGVTRGLLKLVWDEMSGQSVLDSDLSESVLFERLSEATEDDDPRVRENAIPAVALLAFHHDVGSEEVAVSALVAGLEDETTIVRDAVGWLFGVYFWILEDVASSVVPLTMVAIRTLDPGLQTHIADETEVYAANALEPALSQLDDAGWEPTAADLAVLSSVTGNSDPALDAAESRIQALLEEDSVAAVEVLSVLAAERPAVIQTHWEAVRETLRFDGVRGRPSAELVAALSAESPGDVEPLASEASALLYDSLDEWAADDRRSTVEQLVSLAEAAPGAIPPGVAPFVSGDADTDEDDPLAVVAEHDPEAAGRAIGSLLESVDSDDDQWEYSHMCNVLRVVHEHPAVAAEVADELTWLVGRIDSYAAHGDDIVTAIAAGAEEDPGAFEPHIGLLTTQLTRPSPGIHEKVARALRAIGREAPDLLGSSLRPLVTMEPGEDWPIDVLSASAPPVVETMVQRAVGSDRAYRNCTAELIATVADYRPDVAADGVTRLVERADSVGADSSLWSVLKSIAESNPELAAVGLDQVVENAVAGVDAPRDRGRKPAWPLVVLSAEYPQRTWELLERHDEESDPSTLPERASSRTEDRLNEVIEAVYPHEQ